MRKKVKFDSLDLGDEFYLVGEYTLYRKVMMSLKVCGLATVDTNKYSMLLLAGYDMVEVEVPIPIKDVPIKQKFWVDGKEYIRVKLIHAVNIYAISLTDGTTAIMNPDYPVYLSE